MTFEEAVEKVYNDIKGMSKEEFIKCLEEHENGPYAKIILATRWDILTNGK